MNAYDYPASKSKLDKLLDDWVRLHSQSAYRWLVDWWRTCSFFDDLWDGDNPPDRDSIRETLYAAIIDMPANPFFQRHADTLLPEMNCAIRHWLQANRFEEEQRIAAEQDIHDHERGQHDLMHGFVYRNQAGRMLCVVIELLHGRDFLYRRTDIAYQIHCALHPETLTEYLKDLEAKDGVDKGSRQKAKQGK